MKKLIIFFVSFLVIYVNAQVGPGGIGNQDGTNSQPENSLWLRADSIKNLSDGDEISVWTDVSGNQNNTAQLDAGRIPEYKQDIVNGMPVVRFDGTGDWLGVADADNLDGTAELSIYTIFKPTNLDGGIRGLVSKRLSSNNNNSYAQFFWTGDSLFTDIVKSESRGASNTVFVNNNWYLSEMIYDGAQPEASRISLLVSGATDTTHDEPSTTIPNNTSDFVVGHLTGASGGITFGGDIAEVILFKSTLNSAQRIVLENYISAKYDITVANDMYAGDTNANGDYDHGLIGLGQETDGSNSDAVGSGLVFSDNAFLTDNGDYLLAGHNNAVSTSTNDIVSPLLNRWGRIWYLDRTEGGASGNGNLNISFDYSDGGLGSLPSALVNSYVLLYRSGTTGDFSQVTVANTSISGDRVVFEISDANLVDGYFTLGVQDIPPVVAVPIADVTVDEDAADTTVDLALVFSDEDDDDLAIVKTVQGNDNETLLSATITEGNTLTLDYLTDQSGTANITIRGTSNGVSVDDVFLVTVNAVNDPPIVANPIADVTVNEDAANTVIDLTNVFSDVDDAVVKTVHANDNTALVTATITNGNTLTLDYQPDQNGEANITIRGTAGGVFVDDEFLVTVNAVNDPPTVANPITDVTVDEDAANTVIDLTDVFTDVDDTIVKSVQANDNTTLVTATITNGNTLTLDYQPDQSGTANITIRGTAGGVFVDDEFLVTVNAVNDPPVVANPIADVTVDEDAANTVIDLTDVFSDVDDAVVKTVQANDNATVVTATITDGNTLTLDYQPDQSGTANITIRGTAGGVFVDDEFLVTVNAVNDPPVVANPIADVTVDEDAANTVIDLTDVFSDVDDAVVKTVQANDNATVVTATITDGNTLTLDYQPDQSGTANITIRGTAGGVFVDDEFLVTVNAVNDPPVVANPIADVTVDEDAANTVIDLTDVFSDVDDAVVKTVQANDNTTLVTATITDGNTLTLDYQLNQSGTANITIRGTASGVFVDDQFLVTVSEINDPPTVANPVADVTALEDAANTVIDLTNVFTDTDNDPALIVKTVQANSDGALVIATISGGNTLTLDYQPDKNGTANITIRGTSGSQFVDNVFLVTVNAVDDPPTVLNPIDDVIVLEDAENTVIDLTNVFTDIDNNPNFITKIVQQNNNPTIVTATITNGNTLTLDYQTNQTGTATIAIRATSGSQTVDDVFLVTVNAVNDPPTVAAPIDDVIVDEDAVNSEIDLSTVFTDADNDPLLIVKTVQENSNESLVTATITEGNTLTLDFQPNQNGTANITIRGTSGGQFIDDTFIVTVNAVNDAPQITGQDTININEENSRLLLPTDLVISDPDNISDDFVLTAQSGQNFSLTDNTITPAAEFNGEITIPVFVHDGADTSNTFNLNITVLAVNDAPILTLPTNLQFNEDDSLTVSDLQALDWISDPDDPDSLLQLNVVNGDYITAVVNSGAITFKSQADWYGSDTLKVVVSDLSLSDSSEVIITVKPVNDAPIFVDLPETIEFFSASDTIIVLSDFIRDVDLPQDNLTWEISVDNDTITHQFDIVTTELTLSAPVWIGSGTLTITASDDSSASATAQITINVIDDPTSISDDLVDIPRKYELYQNYPNPFNPETNIKFGLPKAGKLSISVYNALGQKVATVLNEFRQAGYHIIKFDAANMPSGIYFYRIKTDDFSQIKKMILIR